MSLRLRCGRARRPFASETEISFVVVLVQTANGIGIDPTKTLVVVGVVWAWALSIGTINKHEKIEIVIRRSLFKYCLKDFITLYFS